MPKSSFKLSWKPVRRGPFYCSPACGGGCTWAAYQRAWKDARACRKRMLSKGWKIRVWENLGWHWGIHKGALSVYPSEGGVFHCMMGERIPSTGGSYLWNLPQLVDRDKDPNRLVTRQRNQCTAVMAQLTFVLKKTFDL